MYFYCNCNVCSNRHDYANILNIKRIHKKKYANHYNYNITINFGHTRYEVTTTLIFIYIINYPLAELNIKYFYI